MSTPSAPPLPLATTQRFVSPFTEARRERAVVIGIGGGGVHAIDVMVAAGLPGARFWAVDTDVHALSTSSAPRRCVIGHRATGGEGAGNDPDTGRAAALEDRERLSALLAGAEVVYLVAGLGGGVGTGAAPVIARLARALGARTVAIVTLPFFFEGRRRRSYANAGLGALSGAVDVLHAIPCQSFLASAAERSTLSEAYELATRALLETVQGALVGRRVR